MGDNDIVSKDVLKRIAVNIARVLLHLQVDQVEIIDTEHGRIEDRRSDLVALMSGAEGQFIMHVEIQNGNEVAIPVRMLRYRTDIMLACPDQDIRQFLIYIGRPKLSMPDHLQKTGLDYRYRIIDMHTVDCQDLLTQDNPEALVLAILCDFKQRPAREVIHFIVTRLQQLTADNTPLFREYMRMLEILSTNRDLHQTIKEEEKMLSQVKYTQLPSYQLGLEIGESLGDARGEARGKSEGQTELLARQITRHFGPLDADTQARLAQVTPEQITGCAVNILDARTLADAFSRH